MASKTFSVSDTNGRYTLTLTLTEGTQSVASNETPLDYKLVLKANTSYNFELYKIGRTITLGGKTVYNVSRDSSASLSIVDYGSLTLAEGSTTIDHDEDGKKTIDVAYSINMASASYTPGPMSGKGTMTLTTIARASEPSLITKPTTTKEFNMGDKITIYTNRKSTNFLHTVQCVIGDDVLSIGSAKSVGASVEWDTSALFPYCTNSKELIAKVRVTTYDGSDVVGSSKSADFTAIIPDLEKYYPDVSMTIAPTPTTIGGLSTTEYVQGKSYVNATIEATPKLSASVKKYSVVVNGSTTSKTTNAAEATIKSAALSKSGNISVDGYAADTRGFTSKIQKSIYVTPYGRPYVSTHPTYGGIQCYRCDGNGNRDDSGIYLKYRFKTTWYTLMSDTNKLTCKIRIVGKDVDSGNITITGSSLGGGSANGYKRWYNWNGTLKSFELDTEKAYVVSFTFTDTIGSSAAPIEFTIPSEKVCFHLGKGGNKAAFGEYAEEDNVLAVAESWRLKYKGNYLSEGFPIEEGEVIVNGHKWNYRKWSNGYAECYGNIDFFNSNNVILTSVENGYGYIATEGSAWQIDFPLTFSRTIPTFSWHGGGYTSLSIGTISTDGNFMLLKFYSPNPNTKSDTGEKYVAGYVKVHLFGILK